MRLIASVWLAPLLAAPALLSAAAPAAPVPTPAPRYVEGYTVMAAIEALAPASKAAAPTGGEAAALTERLRQDTRLESRFTLTRDLSRQEILSTDFILPQGTLILHGSGDRFYAVADPRDKTYSVMDAATLLDAIEGGAGVVNAEYQATVRHTGERKTIAGIACRQSIVTVTYVSTIPFENSSVMVQQKNDIDIWHTSTLVSSAALDHLFFKFQKDRTGTVQKALSAEIGFPMEVSLVVTPAEGAGKKGAAVQPGSLHFLVTEVKVDKKLDAAVLQIPPAGYRKLGRSPFFKDVVKTP